MDGLDELMEAVALPTSELTVDKLVEGFGLHASLRLFATLRCGVLFVFGVLAAIFNKIISY